jgi:hypothetical protein
VVDEFTKPSYQEQVMEANMKYAFSDLGIYRTYLIDGPPSRKDVFKLNAFVACCGASADEKTFYELLKITTGTTDKIEKRTGNVGINLTFGSDYGLDLRKVASVQKISCPEDNEAASPVRIVRYDEKFYFAIADTRITEVNPMSAPEWVNVDVNGKKASSILQNELGNLMGAIPTITVGGKRYQSCSYIEEGSRCNFCALERKPKDVTPTDFAEVARMAYRENEFTTVTLTGGNTISKNRGIEKYVPYVSAINEMCNIPIEVEVSPPRDVKIIGDIADAGATSFMSNIEVFNKRRRSVVCPAKSNIPIEDYMKAFRAADCFGLEIYSVLIVGLEPTESTLNGVEFLARGGVTSVPLPFKPISGAVFGKKLPTNPRIYLETARAAIDIMKDYGVEPSSRKLSGCSTCGGCSVEMDEVRNSR